MIGYLENGATKDFNRIFESRMAIVSDLEIEPLYHGKVISTKTQNSYEMRSIVQC